jgi:hypothetical protein
MTPGVRSVNENMVRVVAIRFCMVVLTAAVLVNGGCTINPVSGMPEVMLVTVEQEMHIGAEEAKKVEQQMGVLDDDRLTPLEPNV